MNIAPDSRHAVYILKKMAFCELPDVLWLTDAMEDGAIPEGVLMVGWQEALPLLQSLSNRYRHASLRGNVPAEPEMAHTILMPLDLDFDSMEDPYRLLTHGRFIFDTTLLVEGQVPTAGFAVKALEKLVAGFAPIITSFNDDFFDGAEDLCANLLRRAAGGAKSVIAVSRHLDEGADCQFVKDAVQGAGLFWHHTTWDSLGEIEANTLGALWLE